MRLRPVPVLALVVGLTVVAALVAALVLARRPVADYDRGTPQGVVQAYVSAVLDGDSAGAAALLAPGSACDAADLDPITLPRQTRIDLVRTDVTGGTARVRIRVVVADDADPLAGSQAGQEYTLRLVRAGDTWRIGGTPWPLFVCGTKVTT